MEDENKDYLDFEFKGQFDILEDMRKEIKYKGVNKSKNNLKKIALVIDVEYWAFANIANQIKKNLSKYYEIDIITVDVFNDNIFRLFLLLQKYELVHFLWRGYLAQLDEEYIKRYCLDMGVNYQEFINNYVLPLNISTSVYDHLFLTDETIHYTNTILKYAKNYTVSSNILKKIYTENGYAEKLWGTITDGVDTEKFYPQNLERFNDAHKRKLQIGWVGNSNFTDSNKDNDVKGFKQIIKPAIEELISEGYNIESNFADRNIKLIPHDKMVEYYNSIDVYICASKTEGTPNPVLESMACGIPIISTNVGIVKEALVGETQKEFILYNRDIKELKEKIKKLILNTELLKKMSDENLKNIKEWTWENKSEEFNQFFKFCLNSAKEE